MPPITLTGELPEEAAGGLWENISGEAASGLWESISELTASNVFTAVIAAVVCLLVTKILSQVLARALSRSRLDQLSQALLKNLLKAVMWLVAASIVLGCLDIEVTSLVAVLSVVGLAFSLALQNFLSNLAGGMQLLASHPFKPGDFVDAGGCMGTVQEIGMFYTKLTTPDNKLVQLPNNTIVSANITNFSAQPTRRVEWKLSAGCAVPTEKVLALLAKLAADHPLILDDPAPAVHVDRYGGNAIGYVMRAWCANGDYWTVYFDVMDRLKPAFDEAGIQMTYPNVNVHMMETP